MKTGLKIIAGFLSLVLILIATAALLLTTMVHSSWLKTQISDYAKSTTGRDLIMKGTLHASLWPRLGITVDDVSLSNPEGFSGDTFLHAQHLTIDAELMPLFHRQLIVNRASLRDAIINLQKNSRGNSNWALESASAPSEDNAEKEKAEKEAMQFNIVALSLIRTTINYADAQTNQRFSITDVNLTAKNIKTDKPFPLQGSLNFVTSNKKKTGIKMNTVVVYDEAAEKITLNNLDLRLKATDFPEMTITGNLENNLNKTSISISPMTLKIGDLKMTGDLSGQLLSDKPILTGHLSSNTFNLNKLLSASKSLHMKNKKALTQVQLTSDLQLSAEKIALKNMNASVDGKTVSGDLEYLLSSSPRLVFALSAEELTVENYLPLTGGDSSAKNKQSSATQSNKARGMVLDGTIAVQRLSYAAYRFSSVKTSVRYAAKQLDLQNFSAGVFGGRTGGSIRINWNASTPVFAIEQKMLGVHAQDLLRTIVGSAKLTGLASVNLSIRAVGSSSDNIKRTLSGAATFNVSNGIITGTDIDYRIDQAIAKYAQRTAKLSDRGHTPFSHFSGSAHFNNGTCSSPNLELLTPTARVQSSGSLNMLNDTIDYKLSCRLLQPQKISMAYLGTKINGDLSNYDLPARVGCTLGNPCVNVDLSGVLKILATEGAKAAAKTIIEKQLIKNVDPNVGKVLDQFFKP